MPTSLSLLINTKNEEKVLDACIASTEGIVDEIVIADMGSTDSTCSIAQKHGAKIFQVRNFGFVEPARKIGEKYTTGKWVLVLDADECLSPKLKKEIPKLIAADHEVIAIPRKNIIFNQWMKGNDYWPNYQIRLYKKGTVQWPATIHAGAVTKKQIYYLSAEPEYALIHTVSVDPNFLLAKTDNYSTHDSSFSEYLKDHAFESDAVLNYLQHGFRFGFVAKEGFKDGFGGYVMSKLMDIYRFAEVAKYWLNHGQPTMKNEKLFLETFTIETEYKNSFFFKMWLKWRKVKVRIKKLPYVFTGFYD